MTTWYYVLLQVDFQKPGYPVVISLTEYLNLFLKNREFDVVWLQIFLLKKRRRPWKFNQCGERWCTSAVAKTHLGSKNKQKPPKGVQMRPSSI